MRFLLPLALFSLAGCGSTEPKDSADTGGPVDTGPTDTGPEDTGEVEVLVGLQGRMGELTRTDTSLTGWEQMYFVADEGEGDDLCRIQYDVNSTGTRDDCDICNEEDDEGNPYGWAFDITFSNPTIVSEAGPGCLNTLGYDKTNISDLEGTTRAMGYTPEYIGHASVILIELEGVWTAVANAEYVEELDKSTKEPTGVGLLTYDWYDGYIEYTDDSE